MRPRGAAIGIAAHPSITRDARRASLDGACLRAGSLSSANARSLGLRHLEVLDGLDAEHARRAELIEPEDLVHEVDAALEELAALLVGRREHVDVLGRRGTRARVRAGASVTTTSVPVV